MTCHEKLYRSFFGISKDEWSPCERCLAMHSIEQMSLAHGSTQAIAGAADVHHTEIRGMGGDQTEGKDKDDIAKLVGVCRECHGILDSVPEENELMKIWAADLKARKIIMNRYLFAEI